MAVTEPAKLSTKKPNYTFREEQRLVQFFMALKDDFVGLRGSSLHRYPLPFIDVVVPKLLPEEIRLKTPS